MGLSVIIPCFNAEKTIIKSIQSILCQTTEELDVEVIVIDDCSNDNSWDALQNYKANCEKNLRIFKNEKNMGAGRTRNRGISLATKKYISFLDSDDEVSNDYIKKILEGMKTESDVIIYNATIKQLDFQEKELKMFYSRKYPAEGSLDGAFATIFTRGCTCGKAYKLELIISNQIEFSSLTINEDTVFTKKALLFARTFYYIDNPIYIYNFQKDSLMHTINVDAQQSVQAYDEISKRFEKDERLNSIYFFEVLYAGTKALILNSNDFRMINKQFRKWNERYKLDKYFWQYNIKYIAFYYMCVMHMYRLIKRIL